MKLRINLIISHKVDNGSIGKPFSTLWTRAVIRFSRPKFRRKVTEEYGGRLKLHGADALSARLTFGHLPHFLFMI